MLLPYFTEESYEKLLNALKINESKYSDSCDWVSEFFGSEEYSMRSKSVEVMEFSPSYTPGKKNDAQKSEEDLINTRFMYDAFKKLTPLQASNKLMWTYLSHCEPKLYDYIRDRWLEKIQENTIKTRFFVADGKNSLFDNGLSRLWWYGHLTYDETNTANPYALTEILLINQTICTDFIDTKNSMSRTRAKGVLTALKMYTEDSGTKGLTDKFRTLNKFLNRAAAVTSLDYLSPEDIASMCIEHLNKL